MKRYQREIHDIRNAIESTGCRSKDRVSELEDRPDASDYILRDTLKTSVFGQSIPYLLDEVKKVNLRLELVKTQKGAQTT